MGTTKLITATLENKPGTLAQVTKVLAKENINVEAVECNAIGEIGFVRLITNNPDKTEKALKKQGYTVATVDCVETTLPNKPGELTRICQALADADVNIEACFASTTPTPNEGRIVFKVDNPEAAQRVLQTLSPRTAIAR